MTVESESRSQVSKRDEIIRVRGIASLWTWVANRTPRFVFVRIRMD